MNDDPMSDDRTNGAPLRLFVGCYTPPMGNGAGIESIVLDPTSGALTGVGTVATAASPSFLARREDMLYAVHETEPGSVSAYRIGGDATLHRLGGAPTEGDAPCHVTVTGDGRYVVCANYLSGSASVHPTDATTGIGSATDVIVHAGSGPDHDRQAGAHLHSTRTDLPGETVLTVDLGTDELTSYTLTNGTLRPIGVARTVAGAGPRHSALTPDGVLYVACELGSTLTTFRVGASALELTSAVPATAQPVAGARNYPAEVALGPGNRFLYVANRGGDCITVFDLSGAQPRALADVDCAGVWPRHLVVVGDLLLVANQNSHRVASFRIDEGSGLPRHCDSLEVPSPACIVPVG